MLFDFFRTYWAIVYQTKPKLMIQLLVIPGICNFSISIILPIIKIIFEAYNKMTFDKYHQDKNILYAVSLQ